MRETIGNWKLVIGHSARRIHASGREFSGLAVSETNGMNTHGVLPEIPSPSVATARRWLLLALGLGLLLRLWNIDYPVWKQPDEQNIVDRALLLGRSGLNPGWFAYPSLFLYVLFAADGAFYAGGRLLGIFASPEQFAAFYFSHPLVFHLIARGLILACGMASLVVIFRIGCAGWGPGVGLAAAGILAVSPVWVDFSRLAKQDMMMVLLLLVAAYGVLRSLDTEGRGWLWAAGVAVGLAASTKYTAGLGVAWLLAAAWIRERARGRRRRSGGRRAGRARVRGRDPVCGPRLVHLPRPLHQHGHPHA
jgi:4-amino-4-deoxy-L-arabinose transferase-like glycosyltransferase